MSIELQTKEDWQVIDGVLTSRIDIEEVVFEGGAVVGWRTVRTAVPASIQHVETVADHSTAPPTSVKTYRITFTDSLPLDHSHRIRSAEGVLFRIMRYKPIGRGALLPEAEVALILDVST